MQRDVLIEWDLESTPLEVRTDSVLGSDDRVHVNFYPAEGNYAGQVFLYFPSTAPQYSIKWCRSWTNFPVTPPSADDKVWRITLTKTAGVRLVIHCNDLKVLDKLLSDETCNIAWSTYWNNDVTKIKFTSVDTASDYYKAKAGD